MSDDPPSFDTPMAVAGEVMARRSDALGGIDPAKVELIEKIMREDYEILRKLAE